ncbi:MAG: FAD-dependent oxidoreductase [Rhabdochlamydiaceae bacterium]|nr:FAD-dependent oxidoreductase [Rhabdochlamydiaceae bacterium]
MLDRIENIPVMISRFVTPVKNSFSKARCVFLCFLASLGCISPLPALDKVDVVVLGGGSAGLTSAIYLSRAGFSTAVLEGKTPGGALTQSANVQNWPGSLEISGFDLMEQMRRQAEASGAHVYKEELVSADLSKRPFSFVVQDVYNPSKKRTLTSDACIVALGATARKLEVMGEQKYWSKGVYTCAVCDGSLYKDKVVAVVGGGDGALLEADYLAGIAKKVYILNRKNTFKGVEKTREERVLKLPNVEVLYDVQVQEIVGDGQAVQSLKLLDKNGKKQTLPLQALFLAIGATPNTLFFTDQLKLDEQGYVLLQKGCETSVSGVYAAGDVADRIFKQAVIASGEGAKAAMQAGEYLQKIRSVKVASPAIAEKEKNEAVSPAKVIEVTSLAQLQKILDANKESQDPVLLDFYATWCGPCRHLSAFTDQWAKDLQGKATFCKVNVDLAREIAVKYRVQAMPTLVALHPEGKEIARKVGVDEIVQYVHKLKNR